MYLYLGFLYRIVIKVRKLDSIVTHIQRKWRFKKVQFEAKITILQILWNKVFGKMSERNFVVKDKAVREILMKLPMVKPHI